ncbi:hypothetical protein CLU88_0764 [Acidovorax sp. 56]|nr:hypothetical protein CLU88_0764 [Acidovorax sp. 56]
MSRRVRFVTGGLAGSMGPKVGKSPGETLPTTETATDAEGTYTRQRKTLTLIERLLVRGGAMPALPPVPAPKKRGRPRKEAK